MEKELYDLGVEELFNEIVRKMGELEGEGYLEDDVIRFNYSEHNMRIERKRFEEDLVHYVVMDIDRDGNEYMKPEEFVKHMACIMEFGDFSDKEIKEILRISKCMPFWRDLKAIEDDVWKLFGSIIEHHKDFHLEFWQGALSCLGGDYNDGDILGRVNSSGNGKSYCNTLYEIYKKLHPLEVKYDCWYTLMVYFG